VKINCSYQKLIPVNQLVPHDQNANKHSDRQIELLAKLLNYQGWRHPIIVSELSGKIVAGHGRLSAALKNGWTECPVDMQKFDDKAQELAFLLSDNFDNMIQDIAIELGTDFDHELLGLDEDIIIIDEDKDASEDDVPEVTESISKLGDIYELGEHRLLCGDSTDVGSVERLMNGLKADMVFTDPPYGVSYTGGHNEKKRSGIENDTLSGQDLTDLFEKSIARALEVSNDHSAFYIWYANGKAVETFASFAKLPIKVRAVLCWYKVRSGLGAFMSQYIPNYEPCIYAFKEGKSPQWFGPSDEKTVWELQKEMKNEFHPTQKPIDLPVRAINNSSKTGQAILDLFGGSGSTLIACEKTNRKCFMMELDPHYTDVIVSRYCKYVGNYKVKRNGEEIEWPSVAT
jgi:DNA modification methylase